MLALFAMKAKKGKKQKTIGVRVDDELHSIIETLAQKEERLVASMSRKLIMEALRARKLIK